MKDTVLITALSAGYRNDKPVIEDIEMRIQEGEWLGLIGPNGAGKSTLIKAMLNLLPHQEGSIVMPPLDRVAYIPEQPVYFDDLTLWEHIQFAKALREIRDTAFETRAAHWLDVFRLDHVRHDYPSSFSKGMQQKLMLVLAFSFEPDLYIIDEPFIGLDPRAMKAVIRALEDERARGASILMSTHVLDAAEKRCDRFVLIDDGRLIQEGTLDTFYEAAGTDAGLLDAIDRLMEAAHG